MTALHKTKDGCFFSSQGEAKGAKQGSCKTAVIRDNAEEAGVGKDVISHGGCVVAGLKSRAGLLPRTQHPHQSSAKWSAETGRTLSTVNTASMDGSSSRKWCPEAS